MNHKPTIVLHLLQTRHDQECGARMKAMWENIQGWSATSAVPASGGMRDSSGSRHPEKWVTMMETPGSKTARSPGKPEKLGYSSWDSWENTRVKSAS